MRRITNFHIIKQLVKPKFSTKQTIDLSKGVCAVCGYYGSWNFARVINNELAQTWCINDKVRTNFDKRESMFCQACGCSFRLRQLAEAILHIYGNNKYLTLNALTKTAGFKSLNVAEINSCGKLHETLKSLPNLVYSEYGSTDRHIPHEDLECLSYNNNQFDLVLTSDTLEHIPDPEKALSEIWRVLKTGGYHIFTIPIMWDRKTLRRAVVEKQKVINLHPPSFHGEGQPDYLVFNEFGHDLISSLEKQGYNVRCYGVNLFNVHDVAGIIITRKVKNDN